MFIEERHQAILDTLKQKGRVSIGEIQESYGVSVDSARRDLRILEGKGLLKRTHGGAIPAVKTGVRPPRERDMKSMEVFDNYASIAKRAAVYVKADDIIYLTSGSLGFIMLDYLPKDIEYTVVVNSVALANELKYWDNIEVYVAGGKMRRHGTASIVDGFAQSFVRNMHFDTCFMTGAGIDSVFGLSNGTSETADFQRAVIEQSNRSILMMPNQKVGFKAFIKVCSIESFDILITDWDAVEDELQRIEESGVEVVISEKEEDAGAAREKVEDNIPT